MCDVRSEEDLMTILIASDIHLGFEENNAIRGEDTFNTLEEILQIAKGEEVDFILLGGDLFHQAKPSPYCIFKCTELLKRYCLGDRPVEIEFLSNPQTSFRGTNTEVVNYEDPNLNVSIPVFSIHGNHDDPTGQRQISAMDLLATTGLVNYFGKWSNHNEVEIEPILLKKGQTQLALYGLSHIKDERLGRLFIDKKVKMVCPDEKDNWFHLLVWHQNRALRGPKNFIPDDALPEFLDFVVWGHEHDCRIEPERKTNDVFVSQPGSTVATSLAVGEAIPKKVGLLRICKQDFNMTTVNLKTVRPFIYEDLVLDETVGTSNTSFTAEPEFITNLVTNKIDNMIQKAKELGRTQAVSEHPLIRLNVRCSSERQIFNTIRLGQRYLGKVANPEDMVKCQVIKKSAKRGTNTVHMDGLQVDFSNLARVEDIVADYFEENDALNFLPVATLNEATKRFIDFSDNSALETVVKHLQDEALKYLEEKMPDEEQLSDCIKEFMISKDQDIQRCVVQALDNHRPQSKTSSTRDDSPDESSPVESIEDDDDDVRPPPSRSSRGAKAASSRGRKRATPVRSTTNSSNWLHDLSQSSQNSNMSFDDELNGAVDRTNSKGRAARGRNRARR